MYPVRKDKAGNREKTEKENAKFDNDIQEMFSLFDKNGDQSISVDEMGKAMRGLGFTLTHKQVKAAVKEIDTNQNGKIELGEFRRYMKKQYNVYKQDPNSEAQIRQAFRVFDRDGNGYIDKSELKRAMKSLGEALTETELQIMFREADVNDDGRIDYEEFVTLWTEKT